jgi:membrane-bound lytic murein transglycosylase B
LNKSKGIFWFASTLFATNLFCSIPLVAMTQSEAVNKAKMSVKSTNKLEQKSSDNSNAGKLEQAQEEVGPAAKFQQWKLHLADEMKSQGANDELVTRIIDSLTYIPKVIKLDRHQPEGRMSHETYLTKVIPPWKVKKAREQYQLNKTKLAKAADSTGVPAHYIVALWGKETNFGTITGNYSVPSALATLAFDGRRAKFFRRELMAAVKILAEGHIELKDIKGSWAGAMGNCQFMPTSFLQFAVDANGDGKKDIWSDKDDIFASMGNYLSRYGWNNQQSWGRQVKLTQAYSNYSIGKKHSKTLAGWQTQGVRRMNGADLPQVEIEGYLIAPGGENGRIYLVYPNFDIIMKWNRSHYFATGVGYLADRIMFPPIE